MFPLSIATEFRIIRRIIIETLKGIGRTGLMNFVIIGTMAAILTIFGCLFSASLGISAFVKNLGSTLEISVYLTPQTSPHKVSNKILSINNVKTIRLIPKEEAWTNLKQQMNVPDIRNPLPDTLRVKVVSPKGIDNTVESIKGIRGVEGVQYARKLADRVQRVGDVTNIVTLIILVMLGGLTLSIISNTIHLVIQARKQEIEIMRMMGVSNWYIKSPYIIQGAIYGLTGALISIVPTNFAQNYITQGIGFFQVSTHSINVNFVIFALLMMGILVGAGGSILSVRKYLKV